MADSVTLFLTLEVGMGVPGPPQSDAKLSEKELRLIHQFCDTCAVTNKLKQVPAEARDDAALSVHTRGKSGWPTT